MGWITKKGAHIFIGDNGTVIKGAKSLIGKSFGGKTYKCTQTNFDPHSVNWNKYQRTVSAMSAEAEFNKKADEYLKRKAAEKRRAKKEEKLNSLTFSEMVKETTGIDLASTSAEESSLILKENKINSEIIYSVSSATKRAVDLKDKKGLAKARKKEQGKLQELFNVQLERKALLESQGKDTSKVDKQLSETSAKLKPSEVRKNPSKYSISVIKSVFRAEIFWFRGFYNSNLDKFDWKLGDEAENIFAKKLQSGMSYKEAASSAIKEAHQKGDTKKRKGGTPRK